MARREGNPTSIVNSQQLKGDPRPEEDEEDDK